LDFKYQNIYEVSSLCYSRLWCDLTLCNWWINGQHFW